MAALDRASIGEYFLLKLFSHLAVSITAIAQGEAQPIDTDDRTISITCTALIDNLALFVARFHIFSCAYSRNNGKISENTVIHNIPFNRFSKYSTRFLFASTLINFTLKRPAICFFFACGFREGFCIRCVTLSFLHNASARALTQAHWRCRLSRECTKGDRSMQTPKTYYGSDAESALLRSSGSSNRACRRNVHSLRSHTHAFDRTATHSHTASARNGTFGVAEWNEDGTAQRTMKEMLKEIACWHENMILALVHALALFTCCMRQSGSGSRARSRSVHSTALHFGILDQANWPCAARLGWGVAKCLGPPISADLSETTFRSTFKFGAIGSRDSRYLSGPC